MSINSQGGKKNSLELELLRQRGARLAEIKEALGYETLEEFGKAIAAKGEKPIDPSTISKMERGLMPISKKVLLELTSNHGVNAEYLLYGSFPKFYKEPTRAEQVKKGNISEQKSIEENLQYTSQNISQNIGVEEINGLSSNSLNTKLNMLENQNYLLAQALANITETNRRLADGLLGMIERDADKNISHPKRKAV